MGDWLPTLFLGHSKVRLKNVDAAGETHARMRMRDRKKQEATSQRAGCSYSTATISCY